MLKVFSLNEVNSVFTDILIILCLYAFPGILPAGEYGANTKINFCCRSDGKYYKPITLPVTAAFYLFKHAKHCQKVSIFNENLLSLSFGKNFYFVDLLSLFVALFE